MKQDVLLLSAGFGTRLGELTKDKPKPMVEVNGKKLIERNLELLSKSGYKKVFINTHYKAEKINNFVGDGSKWNLEICLSHEEEILDTGGGLLNISSQIKSDDILILNSDIVIDEAFNFKDFTEFHISKKTVASLVVKNDPSSDINGQLGINEKNQIIKFLEYKNLGTKPIDVFFTGISLVNRKLFTKTYKSKKISLTRDLFLDTLKSGELLSGYLMQSYWCDAGTPQRLEQAEQYLKNK